MDINAFSLGERFVGMREIAGDTHHPFIVWAHSLCGLEDSPDEVPWCSSWLNAIAWLLDLPRTNSARARSWLTVGEQVPLLAVQRGFDVVILTRGTGPQPGAEVIKAPGHVGLYSHAEAGQIYLLGGNQGDEVNVRPFPVSRVLGIRRLRRAET